MMLSRVLVMAASTMTLAIEAEYKARRVVARIEHPRPFYDEPRLEKRSKFRDWEQRQAPRKRAKRSRGK